MRIGILTKALVVKMFNNSESYRNVLEENQNINEQTEPNGLNKSVFTFHKSSNLKNTLPLIEWAYEINIYGFKRSVD